AVAGGIHASLVEPLQEPGDAEVLLRLRLMQQLGEVPQVRHAALSVELPEGPGHHVLLPEHTPETLHEPALCPGAVPLPEAQAPAFPLLLVLGEARDGGRVEPEKSRPEGGAHCAPAR